MRSVIMAGTAPRERCGTNRRYEFPVRVAEAALAGDPQEAALTGAPLEAALTGAPRATA